MRPGVRGRSIFGRRQFAPGRTAIPSTARAALSWAAAKALIASAASTTAAITKAAAPAAIVALFEWPLFKGRMLHALHRCGRLRAALRSAVSMPSVNLA